MKADSYKTNINVQFLINIESRHNFKWFPLFSKIHMDPMGLKLIYPVSEEEMPFERQNN